MHQLLPEVAVWVLSLPPELVPAVAEHPPGQQMSY
jgi:hypothetical protein